MSRYDDLENKSPEQPDFTCTFIDPVLEELDTTIKELKDIADRLDNHTGRNCDLEQLRQMNIDLRSHGNYWHEKCAELCIKLDEMEEELATARDELAHARDELEELTNSPQSSPVTNDEQTTEFHYVPQVISDNI